MLLILINLFVLDYQDRTKKSHDVVWAQSLAETISFKLCLSHAAA